VSKCFKLLPALVLLLCFAETVSAQGSFFTGNAYRYTPAGLFAASGASVTICTSAGAGVPCTPTITVYKDAALLTPVANPLPVCPIPSPQFGCIDGLGNFSFYASTTGPYTYTISGATLTAYGPIPTGAVTSGSLNAANNWTALQTFSAGLSTTTLVASGLITANAGLTSAGLNTLNGGGTTAGNWTHAGIHTFNANVFLNSSTTLSGGVSQFNFYTVNQNGNVNFGSSAGAGAEANFYSAAGGGFFGGVANGATQSYNQNSQCLGASNNNDVGFCFTRTIGSGTVTTAGTTVNAGVSQAQTGITITGATATDVATCALNAAPVATWQTGIQLLPPVVTSNTVTVWLSNPTAGNITPAATVVRCTVTR
jgi:hypothetical protein